jgi:hypothetical protein
LRSLIEVYLHLHLHLHLQAHVHLLRALNPVRMMGAEDARWTVRWPRRTRYAPMPTLRPVAKVRVKDDALARAVCRWPGR